MRQFLRMWCLLGVLFASLAWAASEFDLDFMQSVEDTAKSLVSNLSQGDSPAAVADAKELEGMFAKIEKHFAAKGNAEDAVAIAKDSRRLAAEILKFAGAKDFDSASSRASELSRNCKSCHKVYKQS